MVSLVSLFLKPQPVCRLFSDFTGHRRSIILPHTMKPVSALLSLCFACVLPSSSRAEFIESDVCVFGATSGGIAAAVQAARMGKSVVIAEPGRFLGGLTTGGLGATDIGNKAAVGGIAREFYARVAKHYADDAAWKFEKREEYFSRRASGQTKASDLTSSNATMW